MKINSFFNNLKRKKILLLGDFFLDEFLYGTCNRVSPEAPVPIINYTHSNFNIGGAGNVNINLANLKAKVVPITILGKDNISRKIYDILLRHKISTKNIIRNSNYLGILKKRIAVKNQHIARIDYEKDQINSIKISFKSLKLLITEQIKKCDLLLISDYGKGVLNDELIKYSIQLANDLKIISVVDPRKKNNDYSCYSGATFITPNLNEIRNIYPEIENIDKSIIEGCRKIKKNFLIENIIVTRGEKGVSFFNKNYKKHIKSFAREVYDVSGAGDTLISCFVVGILGGLDIIKSLKLANLSAGYVVSLAGTQPITLKKFKQFYNQL